MRARPLQSYILTPLTNTGWVTSWRSIGFEGQAIYSYVLFRIQSQTENFDPDFKSWHGTEVTDRPCRGSGCTDAKIPKIVPIQTNETKAPIVYASVLALCYECALAQRQPHQEYIDCTKHSVQAALQMPFLRLWSNCESTQYGQLHLHACQPKKQWLQDTDGSWYKSPSDSTQKAPLFYASALAPCYKHALAQRAAPRVHRFKTHQPSKGCFL